MGAHFKLTKKQSPETDAEKAMMAKVPYVMTGGSLIFVMVCTRVNIAYAVGVVNCLMTNPEKEH